MGPQSYQAYLLRVWRESETEAWRALLEDPHSGERIGFDGVDRLLAYLAGHLAVEPPAPEPPISNDQS